MGLVLGIDPGSHLTGYGLVTEISGQLRCVAFGVLEGTTPNLSSKTTLKPTTAERLFAIGQGLDEIFKQYKPSAVAIEKTFFAKNADSAIKLGQARGVCLYEAARARVPVFEYSPTEIKASLVGTGRADKEQVQFLVRALLGLPAMSRFDMSDALALAIHHARIQSTKEKMRPMETLS